MISLMQHVSIYSEDENEFQISNTTHIFDQTNSVTCISFRIQWALYTYKIRILCNVVTYNKNQKMKEMIISKYSKINTM